MATPIGQWTTVPLQRIPASSTSFKVGVAAFHKDGIQKVSFSVNGGGAIDVTAPEAEDQRDDEIWCYVLDIDPSGESDGNLTVDATIYADDGGPTTLNMDQLVLRNNYGGSLAAEVKYVSTAGNDTTGNGTAGAPYATMYKALKAFTTIDGARIILGPGNHTFGNYGFPEPTLNTTEWFTIEPDAANALGEGVATKANTFITATHSDGLRSGHTRIKNITFVPSTGFSAGIRNARSATQWLWYDGCDFIGVLGSGGDSGKVQNINAHGNSDWEVLYATDCFFQNVRTATSGFALTRNCWVDHCTESPFQNPIAAFNNKITDCSAAYHASTYTPNEVILFRFNVARTNVVIQHCRGYDNKASLLHQTATDKTLTRVAIVDVAALKNAAGAGAVNGSIQANLDHVLIYHTTWGDDVQVWVSPNSRTFADCVFASNWFDVVSISTSGSESDLKAGITWRSNHFEATPSGSNYNPSTSGTDVTVGETDDDMEDDDGGDYRVLATSDAYEAGEADCAFAALPDTGSPRGPRNVTTPDRGAWLDTADPTVGFGTFEAPSTIDLSANTIGLTLTPQAASLTLGTASLAANTAALTLTPQTASLTLGTASPAANALSLTLAPQAASLTLGTVSLAANAIGLTMAPQTADLDAGQLNLAPNKVSLALSPQAASLTLGGVSLAANKIALVLSPKTAALAASTLSLAANKIALTLSPKTATLNVSGSTTLTTNLIELTLVPLSPGLTFEYEVPSAAMYLSAGKRIKNPLAADTGVPYIYDVARYQDLLLYRGDQKALVFQAYLDNGRQLDGEEDVEWQLTADGEVVLEKTRGAGLVLDTTRQWIVVLLDEEDLADEVFQLGQKARKYGHRLHIVKDDVGQTLATGTLTLYA